MFELKVLKPLTDKYDPEKKYKEGDTLLTDEIGRVNDLVARGICSIASVKPVSEKSQVQKDPQRSNCLKRSLK